MTEDLRVRSRVIGKARGVIDVAPESSYVAKADQTVVDSQVKGATGPSESHGSGFKIISPPWDPAALLNRHWNSSALRQNVDAYGVNIHGHGYTLIPRYNLDGEDTTTIIGDAIFFETGREPTPEEIEARRLEYVAAARRERIKAKLFFDYCCSESSFTELRRQMSMEQEIIGHAFWEVRRQADGKIAAFSQVPGYTIRALIPDRETPVTFEVPIMTEPFAWGRRSETRHETLWGQVNTDTSHVRAYFKPFGDTRTISSRTGRAYASIEELRTEEPGIAEATELIQFKVWHPMTQLYGVPRWIGCLKHVLTAEKAEFVNLIFFDNKSIPPLALLVSGGSVTEDAIAKIESYIEDEIAGDASNFHKILIIEAEPADSPSDPLNSGKVRIELVPMTQYIQDDGLFQKYMSFGRECIGESFRNPKIVRGATEGINRATAIAALVFAESQVYGPERQAFDWWVNRFIMPELEIVHWEFRSNSPVATDLDTATAIAELTKVGLLTPEEGRALTSRVFNVDLDKIDEDWTKQPLQLTLAGVLTGDKGQSTGAAELPAKGPVSEASKRLHVESLGKLIEMCRAHGIDPVAQTEEVFKLAETLNSAVDSTKVTNEPETVTLRLPGPIDRYIQPWPTPPAPKTS